MPYSTFLKGKYRLVIETSTKLRKSGETASFQTLTMKESDLILRHVSRTPDSSMILPSCAWKEGGS